jgi:hypothetical protein
VAAFGGRAGFASAACGEKGRWRGKASRPLGRLQREGRLRGIGLASPVNGGLASLTRNGSLAAIGRLRREGPLAREGLAPYWPLRGTGRTRGNGLAYRS